MLRSPAVLHKICFQLSTIVACPLAPDFSFEKQIHKSARNKPESQEHENAWEDLDIEHIRSKRQYDRQDDHTELCRVMLKLDAVHPFPAGMFTCLQIERK